MIDHRNKAAKKFGLDLIVHTNQGGLNQGIKPLTHGSRNHPNAMKKQVLKQALNLHGFDAAFSRDMLSNRRQQHKEQESDLISPKHNVATFPLAILLLAGS